MNTRFRSKKHRSRLGIALFILMTGIAILSLLMRELLNTSSNQANRVRNSADRIQALYLARSSLNLARFILMIDRFIDNQKAATIGASDTLTDLWATPNSFPLAPEEVQVLMSGFDSKKAAVNVTPEKNETLKKCQSFFSDFTGNATSLTTDLSGKLFLNDLRAATSQGAFEVLLNMLKPNEEFVRHFSELGIQPEYLAREIRDYSDEDALEAPSNAPENSAYTSLQLDYEPKNRVYTHMDELKLVPHMDDYIFERLSNDVNPYNIPASVKPPPSRFNLNTISQNVFQALLLDQPDAEAIADRFIKDRDENKRVYITKEIPKTLDDVLRLNEKSIRLNLLTGTSDSFKIETTANVNNIELKLETVVVRATGNKKVDPIIFMRVSP